MCACIPSLAHIKADTLIVEEGTGRSLRLKSWSFSEELYGDICSFSGLRHCVALEAVCEHSQAEGADY